MQTRNSVQFQRHPGHDTIVMGSALIGLGSVCLLHSLGYFPLGTILHYWPISLIVAGLMNILEG